MPPTAVRLEGREVASRRRETIGREVFVHALVLDTSLRACGFALVALPLEQDELGRFSDPVTSAGGRPWCGTIAVPGPQFPLAARIATLCNSLETLVAEAGRFGISPAFAAAETPQHTFVNPGDPGRSSGKGQHALIVQQRTFGAVAQWLAHHCRIPFVEVSPAEAKLAVAGDRRASKREVRAALAVRMAGRADPGGVALPRAWSEAVCDALAVAFWADGQLALHRRGVPSALDALITGEPSAEGSD